MLESTSPPDTGTLHANRYVYLFSVLILIFLIVPFLRQGSLADLTFEVLLLVVLMGSLRATWQDRRVVIAAVVLGLGLLASPGWGLVEASTVSRLASSFGLIGFLAVVTVALSVDVYRARSVTFGTILGACSLYLLIGMFWFGVFGLIEVVQPDSFAFADTYPADIERRAGSHFESGVGMYMIKRGQLFYYTFVTLSTLGYGDIRPVSGVARVYATLAAVTGQLFLAILVARLVGIHTARHVARWRGAEGEG
jgi:hypothetical protein